MLVVMLVVVVAVQVFCSGSSHSVPVVWRLFPAATDLVSSIVLHLVQVFLEEAPPTISPTAVPAPVRPKHTLKNTINSMIMELFYFVRFLPVVLSCTASNVVKYRTICIQSYFT